jgi:hypothetical protein
MLIEAMQRARLHGHGVRILAQRQKAGKNVLVAPQGDC